MARKTIHWLHGEIKTPPLSIEARREFGFLLRMVQEGEPLSMPHSRPMPGIGSGCHELRVRDSSGEWRLIYALVEGEIAILDFFKKTTPTTPDRILKQCAKRLTQYKESI